MAPRSRKDLEVVCLSAHIACSVEENLMLTHSYFETMFFFILRSQVLAQQSISFVQIKYFIF